MNLRWSFWVTWGVVGNSQVSAVMVFEFLANIWADLFKFTKSRSTLLQTGKTKLTPAVAFSCLEIKLRNG